MIKGVECLVQIRADLFKVPIYESVAEVVFPILFGLSIVSLHYTYLNDATWMSVIILPYALAFSLVALIQKVHLFIGSTSSFMDLFQIDQKESIIQLFNKTVVLRQEIRDYKGFESIYIIIGGIGLATALLTSLIAVRKPFNKLACITISSIGLIVLGLASYNAFIEIPNVEALQDKLGDCITSRSTGDICEAFTSDKTWLS